MTLVLQPELKIETFETAATMRDKIVWDRMDFLTVGFLLNEWVETLSPRTRINYESGVRKLAATGLINSMVSCKHSP